MYDMFLFSLHNGCDFLECNNRWQQDKSFKSVTDYSCSDFEENENKVIYFWLFCGPETGDPEKNAVGLLISSIL